MARPEKKEYTPINPQKYVGDYPIVARSSWEWEFMEYCDKSSGVIEWCSEPTIDGRRGIPYSDPTRINEKTGSPKQSIYIPDFLVRLRDHKGQDRTKLIEIKPLHEAVLEYCRNEKDLLVYVRNQAKWAAAEAWCARRGIEFKVATEAQLYRGYEKVKPPVKKAKKPGRKRK